MKTLHIGDHITVDFWYPVKTLATVFNKSQDYQDKSWVGDVLEVKAVNYPQVVVKRLSRYSHNEFTFVIDLQMLEVKPLEPDYVKALIGI